MRVFITSCLAISQVLRGLPGSHHPQTQTTYRTHPFPGKGGAGVTISTFWGETTLKNLLAPAAWLGREREEVWLAAVRGKRWREQTRGGLRTRGERLEGGSGEGRCLQVPGEVPEGAQPGSGQRSRHPTRRGTCTSLLLRHGK